NGYEEKYIQAIESKKDEIAKATDLFIKNLNILNDYYNGNEIITEEVEELEEVTEDITEEIEANSDEIN
ncbi:MAG TPA: hypothetical protein PK548_07250, partial [Bacteroidales bacterium]|nr:hypothetical protein [Bacteroidales bacterium]